MLLLFQAARRKSLSLNKEKLNILGIIPARGGSKEVLRKNLLKLKNKTLIELAIDSSNQSELLSRTIFSSDDNEMIDIAKSLGCETPFIRPKDLATDEASAFSVVRHASNWLKINDNWESDIIVLLQPTTPFRKGHHIDGVINLLLSSGADATITIRKPDYPPHWMLNLNKSNKKISNIISGGNGYKRRQDTPPAFQPAGMVYAFKSSLLNEINTLFPYKDTRGFEVSQKESVNIDTYIDYLTAKAIIEEEESYV